MEESQPIATGQGSAPDRLTPALCFRLSVASAWLLAGYSAVIFPKLARLPLPPLR